MFSASAINAAQEMSHDAIGRIGQMAYGKQKSRRWGGCLTAVAVAVIWRPSGGDGHGGGWFRI